MTIPSLLTLHRAARLLVLVASTAWLSACGGGETDLPALAEPAALVVRIDVDAFASPEAVARAAAQERGAPGEDERVLLLLQSRHAGRAEAFAETLARQGFAAHAVVF